jgi:RimJ/RimL family protein N-acetyltransferase
MSIFRAHRPQPESVALPDGALLAIRPIAPGDKAALMRTFERLSEESRYRRFFSPKQHLSEAELAYFTELDHSDREAFVAIDPESDDLVGVARYTRSPSSPQRAELAVVVADDWQRRGVARLLLERLTAHARHQGITFFSARMKSFNQAALAAIGELGEVRELTQEATEVEALVELPESGIGSLLRELLRTAARHPWIVARTLADEFSADGQNRRGV